MDYRKLKSGSDVRGVAVGEGATLTPDVAKTLGMAFARYVAGKTGKPVVSRWGVTAAYRVLSCWRLRRRASRLRAQRRWITECAPRPPCTWPF